MGPVQGWTVLRLVLLVALGAASLALVKLSIDAGVWASPAGSHQAVKDLTPLAQAAYAPGPGSAESCPALLVPPAPVGVLALAAGGAVDVRWQLDRSQKCLQGTTEVDAACGFPADGFLGYDVYRLQDTGEESWSRLRGVPCGRAHWHDPGAAPHRRTLYQVRAVTQHSAGPWSMPAYWPHRTGGENFYLLAGGDGLLAGSLVPGWPVKAAAALEGALPGTGDKVLLPFPACLAGEQLKWYYLQPERASEPQYRLVDPSGAEVVGTTAVDSGERSTATIQGYAYEAWGLTADAGDWSCESRAGLSLELAW